MRLFISLKYRTKLYQNSLVVSTHQCCIERSNTCAFMRVQDHSHLLTTHIADILDLADSNRGLFTYVLLQLRYQTNLRQLFDSADIAKLYTITPEMLTNPPVLTEIAHEHTSRLDIPLNHLVRPLLLTNTITYASKLTEIDSISETDSNSLIRHQKSHNSDLFLENSVVPALSENFWPPYPAELHSDVYTIGKAPTLVDIPLYPSLTGDVPHRELRGSWGQRPCQPGSRHTSADPSPNPNRAKGRPQTCCCHKA